MINAEKVARIMGGMMTFKTTVTSTHDLVEVVVSGLPKQSLKRTAQRVYSEPKQVNELVYRLVPEATYKRRTRLTQGESEKTERLARVIAAAEHVWEDDQAAREWLTKSHPELGNKTPIDSAMSELGAREVEELLDKLFYGLPS
jgi:putative toxin-antitoxin system antitoxin component (TIGR02293 family)